MRGASGSGKRDEEGRSEEKSILRNRSRKGERTKDLSGKAVTLSFHDKT